MRTRLPATDVEHRWFPMTARERVTSSDASTTGTRPLRADAQRNRAALLEAARTVFRRDGLSAQMDAIAHEAGLGVGTLYRHFPSRDALVAVLVHERFRRLVASAEAARRVEDPWGALAGLVWELAAFESEDRTMVDILADTQPDGMDAAMAALLNHLGALVARAQAAGQMRGDVSAQDVLAAVCSVGKMMASGLADGDGRWRRLMRIILDGLRTSANSTL